MICVSKEYEIKTKMVQEKWLQLKMTFLFFNWVELTFGGEGGMSKFLAGVGGLPSFRSRETLYIYIYSIYIYI